MDTDSLMLGALIGMVVLGLLLAATHRTYRRTLQHCADCESAEKLPDGRFYYLVREDRYNDLSITRGRVAEIEREFVTLHDLPAWIRKMQDRLRADQSDAERFRWLTEDHADPDQREACRNLLDRMARMSYSAACMSIDVHRNAGVAPSDSKTLSPLDADALPEGGRQ
jgi:hypothetical protein